jgi:hypothetical protein
MLFIWTEILLEKIKTAEGFPFFTKAIIFALASQ